jgi:hypothetical protein
VHMNFRCLFGLARRAFTRACTRWWWR